MKSLQGKVAVITGAAHGIGEALALSLAARGCTLALVDRNAEGLEAVASALGTDVAHSTHVLDVTDRAAIFALAEEVRSLHGGTDILVNNAGITIYGSFEHHSEEDFRKVMEVNVMGVVHGCHAFLPQLKRRRESWLINISSLFGFIGVPNQSAYCTSKFAVRGFSETLRAELRGTGVRVICVHPGGIATRIIAHTRYASGADPDDPTLTRVARMFEKYGMPPAGVARHIERAIDRGRPRVLVAPETHLFDTMVRLSPVHGGTLATWALNGIRGFAHRDR